MAGDDRSLAVMIIGSVLGNGCSNPGRSYLHFI